MLHHFAELALRLGRIVNPPWVLFPGPFVNMALPCSWLHTSYLIKVRETGSRQVWTRPGRLRPKIRSHRLVCSALRLNTTKFVSPAAHARVQLRRQQKYTSRVGWGLNKKSYRGTIAGKKLTFFSVVFQSVHRWFAGGVGNWRQQ